MPLRHDPTQNHISIYKIGPRPINLSTPAADHQNRAKRQIPINLSNKQTRIGTHFPKNIAFKDARNVFKFSNQEKLRYKPLMQFCTLASQAPNQGKATPWFVGNREGVGGRILVSFEKVLGCRLL